MTNYISLFSGAMGLDLGLEMAGFHTGVCVENDQEAVATIKHNKASLPVFDCSIIEVSGQALKKTGGFHNSFVPLVAGGPPATFLMENVRGLLSMSIVPNKTDLLNKEEIPQEYFEKGSLMKKIFLEFNRLGYHVDCFVVNSVNYGAPQIRERVLLIGNRFGYSIKFPSPQYSNRPQDNLPAFTTLGDAIDPCKGFIDRCPDVLNFSPRKLKYLSMVPEGGNWRSLPVDIQKESMGKSWYLKGGRSAYWRKLSYNFPSPTVVTMPNHAGTSMCHPKELRAISVGEAAAIQEFPTDWEFQGTTSAKFRQIGNAVPTRLGKVAGQVLKDLLAKIELRGKALNPICSHTITHLRPHVRTRTFWKNGQSFVGDTSYYEQSENKSKQLELF